MPTGIYKHKKGIKNTLGKHWKVRDTSKISESKKGMHPSEETRKKLRWIAKNRKFSEKTREKLRIARLRQQLPITDTSIELKFKAYLDERKMNYIHPFNLGNKFQCDFYLPFLNLIVECDGEYWHNRPDMKRRDRSKDTYAKKCGFNILRLTEKQINQGLYPIL